MTTDDELGLADAYALETPDDSRKLYAAWADTYDSGFRDANGYVYHEAVADVFAARWGGAGTVLDVGCGTGAVGEALSAKGIVNVDGVDISPEMLDKAREKDTYRKLMEADLTEGIDVETGAYTGVVSAGTFTHGHLPPDALAEVIRVTALGGLIVVGVNSAHFIELGFDRWLEQATSKGKIRGVESRLVKVYEHSDPENRNEMSTIVICQVG